MSKFIVHVNHELEDIIPPFLENRNKDMGLIKEALTRRDFRTMEVVGHNMRGACGGFGFEKLSEIGARLEVGAQTRDASRCERCLLDFVDFMKHYKIVFK